MCSSACSPARQAFQGCRSAPLPLPPQCVTDCYIYQFAPAMWKHFRPGQPWGVPTILALRLAPLLGIQAPTIQSALRVRGATTRAPA